MSPVDLVYGPMMIGVIFNAILYGVMVVQSFIYYQTYTRDETWIRYFILYLFIIETMNTGFDIGIIYQPLITQFGTMEALMFFPYMLASAPIMTILVSTPVQIFTAWRISIISKNKLIGLVICALALLSFAGGLWTAIDVAVFRSFARKAELNKPGIVWFVASAVADILITMSLIFSLTRRKTGFATTDTSINRIIRLTIQTGLITSVFAMADLISFCVSPHTAISFTWDFALSKLYSNALLSTLNARLGWSKLNTHGQNQDNVLFGTDMMGNSTNSSDPTHAGTSTKFQFRTNPDIATHVASSGQQPTYEMDPVKPRHIPQGDRVHVAITKDVDVQYDHPNFNDNYAAA